METALPRLHCSCLFTSSEHLFGCFLCSALSEEEKTSLRAGLITNFNEPVNQVSGKTWCLINLYHYTQVQSNSLILPVFKSLVHITCTTYTRKLT